MRTKVGLVRERPDTTWPGLCLGPVPARLFYEGSSDAAPALEAAYHSASDVALPLVLLPEAARMDRG